MKKIILAIFFLGSLAIAKPTINLKAKNKVIKKGHIDLSDKFVLVLEGTVVAAKMEALTEKLEEVPDDGIVHLVISSYGGSVDAGLHFINRLQALKAQGMVKEFNCYIQDNAMSMAAMISSYCNSLGIHKFGSFLHHPASYGVRGSHPVIEKRVVYIGKWLDNVWVEVAENYGIKSKQFTELVGDEILLEANDTVRYGFADYIFDTLYHNGYTPEEEAFSLFGF